MYQSTSSSDWRTGAPCFPEPSGTVLSDSIYLPPFDCLMEPVNQKQYVREMNVCTEESRRQRLLIPILFSLHFKLLIISYMTNSYLSSYTPYTFFHYTLYSLHLCIHNIIAVSCFKCWHGGTVKKDMKQHFECLMVATKHDCYRRPLTSCL